MLKKLLLGGLLLIALVGLPLTVYVFQNQTKVQTHASGGTTLSLIPQPGPSSTIQKTLTDTVPVDLMVDPGGNAVTIIRLQVKYDPNKLTPTVGNPFTPTTDFPTILDGPVVSNGTISELLSVGADTSKAITTVKKVGTFNFKATGVTSPGVPTVLSFTNQTQAFSSGANDQAAENILTGANPASITIISIPPTPTLTPTPTVIPSPTPTPTPTPTDTPTPTPTPAQQITTFSVTTFLHGIGNSGDNTNPNAFSLSNKNPNHTSRRITLSVYNSVDQHPALVTKTGNLDYNFDNGNFQGTISLGTVLPTGDYIIRIKTDSFLQRRVPGFVHITPFSPIIPLTATLIAGDPNFDNPNDSATLSDKLDLVDYNMIIGCYSDFAPATFCDDVKAGLTDLNDDGHVNQVDYNLFLREISNQSGN